MVSMRRALEPDSADGKLDEDALRSAFEDLMTSDSDSDAMAVLTVAIAQLIPIDDYAFFDKHPRLWQKCARLAASTPLEYEERGRILQEDLLYNHYRDALFLTYRQDGLDSALQVILTNDFLTSGELGRRVGQNALLALVREGLRGRSSELIRVRAAFPDMGALVRKIDQLLGD
ncbi:MAG: hypothetical protein AAF447_25840 [Myxococcota bacterium]